MKLDERDDALGAMLDRSLEGIGSTMVPDAGSLMRRGTRRRATTVVVSVLAASMFVGAATFAAVQFGSESQGERFRPGGTVAGPTSDPVRFDPAEGWAQRSDAGYSRHGTPIAWTADVPLPIDTGLSVTPPGLIESLADDEVFIVAWQVIDETPAPDDPNFPPMDLPLSLPTKVESSWEGYIEGKGRTALSANVGGRAIQIWVFYGTPDPSEAVMADAAAALGRLQVVPAGASTGAPAELPPPTHQEYRFESVSDAEFRVWPISGPVEPGVVYRFEVPHCGLAWLTDFDGSFWRPIDPNQPEPEVPSFFFNPDSGTMELVAPNTAEYVSSEGRVVTLVRLDGSIVRPGCD